MVFLNFFPFAGGVLIRRRNKDLHLERDPDHTHYAIERARKSIFGFDNISYNEQNKYTHMVLGVDGKLKITFKSHKFSSRVVTGEEIRNKMAKV